MASAVVLLQYSLAARAPDYDHGTRGWSMTVALVLLQTGHVQWKSYTQEHWPGITHRCR